MFCRSDKKAAIGYTYEDSTSTPTKSECDLLENEEEEAEESSDEEVDLGTYVLLFQAFATDRLNFQEICP